MEPLLERRESSQAVPLAVVISTAVAVAGSFVFGISVCIYPSSTLTSWVSHHYFFLVFRNGLLLFLFSGGLLFPSSNWNYA
jgi:hypothetical protein